ncbi:selenium-binding protein 2-like isoform X2 [Humulus lupulus]|uniref:selenium-binding protein 2-like isoform X2 n=1 Tax=Humulus lupulus TaxID=3486 RepID=UPI002B412BF0|nr:selenium-binding protein 2-like isoform X2 [Humulus lupulus]
MATDVVVLRHGSAVEASSCKAGPGYASPREAMAGPKEALLYVTCLYTGTGRQKPDYLATVDVDPTSPTYSTVIHRLFMPYLGDELHHTGWNSCSSCHTDPSAQRRFLIVPGLVSGLIYVVDTKTDLKAPSLHKVVESEEIVQKTGLAFPHTSHCLASGEIMVSCLGDKNGNAKGNGFLLLDSEFNVKGRWEKEGHSPEFGYDFWYQPRHKTMISSSMGAPATFTKGFNLEDVSNGLYGRHLYVYNWPGGELKQTLDLGNTGIIPLEVVISVKPLKVQNWIFPDMPGLINDLLISLDDRFLYFVNWLHGDVRQYNIEDPKNPKLTGQVWVGGQIQKGSPVLAEGEDGQTFQFDVPKIQGQKLRGGPHRMQMSLDGKRLYVTNSLLSSWDCQFYPEIMEKGSHMLQLDVDSENGGLAINPNFFVDFGAEPDGPSLAHEMRYPGGDCTSDIWV